MPRNRYFSDKKKPCPHSASQPDIVALRRNCLAVDQGLGRPIIATQLVPSRQVLTGHYFSVLIYIKSNIQCWHQR